MINYQIQVASENGLIIYFNDNEGQISPLVSAQVQQAQTKVMAQLSPVLLDVVPSYASLLITFDPFLIDQYSLRHQLRTIMSGDFDVSSVKANVVELPVYYGEEVALDLMRIAQRAKLTPEQVIELHSQQQYQVYTIGFAPGFAYLGEVNQQIATPRLATPRSHVPKGAVAIADRQTAIYPAQSPGGWNIIGRCPVDMFDAENQPHMPIKVGDTVTFKPIDKQHFLSLGGQL